MLQYANPAIVQLPLGTPEGLRINRPSAQEILITSGRALIRRTVNVRQMAVNSGFFTKILNATWQQGATLGGRASGVALSANTIYHVFSIINSSGTFDAYFDTSATADNRPSGWDARMIGSFLTDGSLNIWEFDQQGNRFEYLGLQPEALATANLTTSSSNVLTLPTPSVANAFGTILVSSATSSVRLSPEANTSPRVWISSQASLTLTQYWEINGNRMRLYADVANVNISLRVHGFDHPRGANG